MENRFLIIIFLILSIVFFSIVSSKSKKLKEYKFRTILYILVTGLLLGSSGFITMEGLLNLSNTHIFYLLLLWMLCIGLLHVAFYYKLLPWASKKGFWIEFLFTLLVGLIGATFLLVAFHFSNYTVFAIIFLISLLAFLIPFLFYATYILYINIPVKILRKWHYPVDKHIEDPNDREMESPLVIGFEFKKQASDENMTTFRAKAPKEMTFGKLFYYFINDYNDRNPDEKIQYLDEKEKPIDFIFYFKPRWFSSIRYIDPEETNSFNFIKENSVIVCKRVTEK